MATNNTTPSERPGAPIPSEQFEVQDEGSSLFDGMPDKPARPGYKWEQGANGKWRQVPIGGSNGGTRKPPDPYAPVVRSFFSAYFKIWGTLPPPGYVEGAARSMNLYEFIDQERKKPAFRHTKAYKNDAAKFAALRDQLLGYY